MTANRYDGVPWMAPVSAVLKRAQELFATTHANQPFTALREFAARNLGSSHPKQYEPSFCRRVLEPGAPKRRSMEREHFDHVAKAVDHIEHCVAYALASALPQPKPLANYVAAANWHLAEASRILDGWPAREAALRATRRRCAIERHKPTLPARAEAARLLRSLGPTGMGLSRHEVAVLIAPELWKFIERHHIPLKWENLVQRVIDWTKTDPAVRDAYAALVVQ
jgi:hypothetical protein